MGKGFKHLLILFSAIVLLIFITTCASLGMASLNQANVEKGAVFNAVMGEFDPTMSISEFSFLVCLPDAHTSKITAIDGRPLIVGGTGGNRNQRLELFPRFIYILKPGTRTITVTFYDEDFGVHVAGGFTYSALVEFDHTFEAGKIYYLSGGQISAIEVSYNISELSGTDPVYVPKGMSGKKRDGMYFPVNSIITGVNEAIKRQFRNHKLEYK